MNNIFDTLSERGFIHQTTNLETLNENKIKAYVGFDPTASSFHVGNLVQLMLLAHLQHAGHQPIALIGGGTGMIGDPSGKTELRKILTKEQIDSNINNLKKQIQQYVPDCIILNNADWLLPLNYINFLRDVGKHFSVNRMLTMDSVKNRLETGLSFIEFNYMLLQAYDFLHLFDNYNCVLQFGGEDQWGNICAGIELIRRVKEKTVYGLTSPLITTATGIKMGKTVNGAMWLSKELISPYEYYQYWRNTDDRDVYRFLSLFTFLPMSDIQKLKEENINDAKEILAFEATKIAHGEKDAIQAQQDSKKIFDEKNITGNIRTVEICQKEIRIVDLFYLSGLTTSKNEARRLIEKGGAYIDQKKVESIDDKITEQKTIVLRSGKKNYVRVIIK